MIFEIDVSGEDLLSKNYVICIADKNSLIKGFKFDEEIIRVLSSKYGQGLYRYKKSKKDKANFKVRLYSIVIYYLFKSINPKRDISLTICRDFEGKENDIRENLRFFLDKKLNIRLNSNIHFGKLDKNSNADKYAYLMRKDVKNKMNTYVKIELKDFEKWLKK